MNIHDYPQVCNPLYLRRARRAWFSRAFRDTRQNAVISDAQPEKDTHIMTKVQNIYKSIAYSDRSTAHWQKHRM